MQTPPDLGAVADVEVPVAVTLAKTNLSLEEIIALRPGSTLRFRRGPSSPAALEVDGVPVGCGTVVVNQGRLGLRLDALEPGPEPRETARS